MRTAGFLQARHRFFGRTALYVMPQERCLEIDEPIDFEHAEVRMLAQSREARLARLPEQIDALFLDFDGVLTDNQVVTYQDGSESVSCDRSDGLGIAALRLAGVPVSVLSTERNPVVAARCRKLGIDCLQGLDDKGSELARLLVDRELDPQRVVFVGNDVNDLSCMAQVGCSVAVADAVSQVRAAARLVLAGAGGHGAVRELCDMIVQRRSINERND
jgi:N-acylneuraminate cytidylyltransferase